VRGVPRPPLSNPLSFFLSALVHPRLTVAAVKPILAQQLHLFDANSSHLNAITEVPLRAYKLLIVPGGHSITIGNNLKAQVPRPTSARCSPGRLISGEFVRADLGGIRSILSQSHLMSWF